MRAAHLGLKELGLAAFLVAGHFKADPRLGWLPVDLTLLFAGWTLLALLLEALRTRPLAVPRALLPLLAFFLALSPSLLGSGWDTYAAEKAPRLFSLTLLAAVAPLLLLRDEAALRRFLRALALLGALMGLDGALTLLRSSGLERLQAFSADTITLGRATGTTFVWVAILWLERRVGLVRGVAALGALAATMLASGTRASLLAAAAAILAAALAFYWREGRAAARLALGAVVLTVGLAWASPRLPGASVSRVQALLQGEVDDSVRCRLEAYSQSLAQLPAHPLGIGLGDFPERIPLRCGPQWLRYPHNLPLELALESGVPVALLLIALCALALRTLLRCSRAVPGVASRALFALFAFYLVNVMFSGDLNDNRLFFSLLGLSLGAAQLLRVAAPQRPPQRRAAARPASALTALLALLLAVTRCGPRPPGAWDGSQAERAPARADGSVPRPGPTEGAAPLDGSAGADASAWMRVDAQGVALLLEPRPSGAQWLLGTRDPDTLERETFDTEGDATEPGAEAGLRFWSAQGHLLSYASGIPDSRSFRLHVRPAGGAQQYGWRSGALEHGYLATPSDPVNLEATVYVRVRGHLGSHTSMSWIFRGGAHGDARPDLASCVGMTVPHGKEVAKAFRELDHPDYDYVPLQPRFPFALQEGRWLAVKLVSFREAGGTRNRLYLDPEPFDAQGRPRNAFQLFTEWRDEDGVSTGRYARAATWAGWQTTFRVDGWERVDFALLSVHDVLAPGE